MAHTPGEWKYGVRKDGSIWLSIGNPRTGPHYQGDLHVSEADARLIVAAPDLLETLEWVRSNYASGPTSEINARIDAAISKATA